jgi:hypothetical protein
MKYYLSKYALSTGEIHLVEVDPRFFPAEGRVYLKDYVGSYRLGQDVHEEAADALAAANTARDAKIASLSRQVKKLKNLDGGDRMKPCGCRACLKNKRDEDGFPVLLTTFVVCPQCQNKRCPKADDHKFKCSGSNEVNQVGELEDDT